MVIAAFGLLGGITIVAYWADVRGSPGKGATTEVAFLLAFCIGVTVGQGGLLVASATAVALTLILSVKSYTRKIAQTLTETEIRAGMRFLVLSIIILPLAPDHGFGPYDAINLREIWLMVVLITGLSFSGYWMSKWFGPSRGIPLAGLLGGLASSSAATLSISRMVRSGVVDTRNAASGIVAAAMMMVVRAGIVVSAISGELIAQLWPGLSGLVITGLVISYLFGRFREGSQLPTEGLAVRNPLEMGSAIIFSLFLAAITLLAAWASDQIGEAALFPIAAIAGLIDVDAVTIAASRQAVLGTVEINTASLVIMLAIGINTLVKGLIALVAAGFKTARLVLPMLLGALGVGAIMVWLF